MSIQKAEVSLANRDFTGARKLLRRLLLRDKINKNAMYLLSIAEAELGNAGEALSILSKIIVIDPHHAAAHYTKANLLLSLNKHLDALPHHDRAVKLLASNPWAFINRGISRAALKNFSGAIDDFDTAIGLDPRLSAAFGNKGNALLETKLYEHSLQFFNKAIEIDPFNFDALSGKSACLSKLGRPEEAVIFANRAIELKPDYAEAWTNRGVALNDLKRHEEALASYERAIGFKPDIDFILGNLVHTQMKICDWTDLEQRCRALEKILLCRAKVSNPFPILGLFDNPELQRQCAEIYSKDIRSLTSQLGPIAKRARLERIRIGYFSADFHNHATMYLMAELFEFHDKNKFEIYAFSFGPNINDEMRRRAKNTFCQFFEVNQLSDTAVAALSREYGIDIAIDLKGYTQDSRPEIFAERAAPIQINYLGFPGTMGAQYLDYLIADPQLIPPDTQRAYSEKVIYLPNSYQVNDSKRRISDQKFTRQELGLPANGFVFCCFNNNWKITPDIFDCWMSILQSIDNSVLWLFEENPAAAKNLLKEAAGRGVDPNRLVFAKRMPHADHLARYNLADLFLDTFPYNAHTTASDALWIGIPVVTLQGQSFAARVAASLLINIGIPELITHSKDQYRSLAIELAMNPNKLAAIKAKITQNRLTKPLFNTKLFTRHIETAYKAIYDRYHAGLPPDHIYVDP